MKLFDVFIDLMIISNHLLISLCLPHIQRLLTQLIIDSVL